MSRGIVALLLVLTPGFASAENPCARDVDCAGERVCEARSCVVPPMPAPRTFFMTPSQRVALLDQRWQVLESSRPTMAWPVLLLTASAITEVTFLVLSSSFFIAFGIGAAAPLLLGLVFTLVNAVRNLELSREQEVLRRGRRALDLPVSRTEPQLLELARF